MLNVFETLTLTALVSESEDYIRYDLHAGKKITVTAWQEDSLKRNFDIGKPASSFRHTFVKLNDDSRVFHARDDFRGKFDLAEDNLRDKSVLSFKITDIQEIQIDKDQTLTALAKLSCDEYIKDRNKDAFSNPIYTVKLKGIQDYQLDIFAKLQTDDKNYPAVSSANDYPFFLSDSKVQQFMKDPEEMLKKPESNEKTSEPPKSE
jgi:hypothetical protein